MSFQMKNTPAGKTIKTNGLHVHAAAISNRTKLIAALVSPQPGQCTPKIVVHRHGTQISISVIANRKTEKSMYVASRKNGHRPATYCQRRLGKCSTFERSAITILETARHDHDQVHKRPDSTPTKCEQLHDADTDMTGVKTVHAEVAEKKTQQQGSDPTGIVHRWL